MGSLDVDSGDVIKLVLQFLKENNLLEAMDALERTSQVSALCNV